jgi:hypothetical protein
MKVQAYRFSDRPEVLLARLQGAAVQDKHAEKMAKRLLIASVLCLVAALPAVLVVVSLDWPFLLSAVLPVAFVVLLVFHFRHKGHDLDDRKLAAATRLLKVLKADIPASHAVQLHVDFRDHRKGGRLLGKTGSRFGAKSYKYTHRWLELRTRLADGNAVALSVTDRVARKEKPKRKYTKVREKHSELLVLALRLDKRYGSAEEAVKRLAGLAPRGALRVARQVGRGRILKAAVTTPSAVSVSGRMSNKTGFENLTSGDSLLQVLRWAYRGLAPSKAA